MKDNLYKNFKRKQEESINLKIQVSKKLIGQMENCKLKFKI